MVNEGVEGVKTQDGAGVFHRPYDSLQQENVSGANIERQKQIAEAIEPDSKVRLESWMAENTKEKSETGAELFENSVIELSENKENEAVKPEEPTAQTEQIKNEILASEEKTELRTDEVGTGLPKAKDRDGLESEYETEVERVMKFKSPREKVLGAWKLTKKLLRERYGREVGDGNVG